MISLIQYALLGCDNGGDKVVPVANAKGVRYAGDCCQLAQCALRWYGRQRVFPGSPVEFGNPAIARQP